MHTKQDKASLSLQQPDIMAGGGGSVPDPEHPVCPDPTVKSATIDPR